MKVMFKGVDGAFECTEPVEQKLFQSGEAIGWAVMFHLHGGFSSSDIDRIVTPDSISELAFLCGDDESKNSISLTGYTGIRACTIRHREGSTAAELQFTKASTPEKEGAAENG